jgi:hypothetical protein
MAVAPRVGESLSGARSFFSKLKTIVKCPQKQRARIALAKLRLAKSVKNYRFFCEKLPTQKGRFRAQKSPRRAGLCVGPAFLHYGAASVKAAAADANLGVVAAGGKTEFEDGHAYSS